jgi:peroxiredoxin Q/BCP
LAKALGIGEKAPLVALVDQDGVERRSDQLQGQPLVLFFYPKDDTPGCTMEVCAFARPLQRLQRPRRGGLGRERR